MVASDLERHGPVERCSDPTQVPKRRVVLLYLDPAGGFEAGWEWESPQVEFEQTVDEADFWIDHPIRTQRVLSARLTATISGGAFKGLIREWPSGAT